MDCAINGLNFPKGYLRGIIDFVDLELEGNNHAHSSSHSNDRSMVSPSLLKYTQFHTVEYIAHIACTYYTSPTCISLY